MICSGYRLMKVGRSGRADAEEGDVKSETGDVSPAGGWRGAPGGPATVKEINF